MRNSRLVLLIIALALASSYAGTSVARLGAGPVRELHVKTQVSPIMELESVINTQTLAIENLIGQEELNRIVLVSNTLDIPEVTISEAKPKETEHPTREEQTYLRAASVLTAVDSVSQLPQSHAQADYRAIPSLRQHLPITIDSAAGLSGTQRNELECLAWNIYFEVRGGTRDEQIAVAYVPINRIGRSEFSNDICSNVFQFGWAGGRRHYQFSWAGIVRGPHWKREDETWEKVQQVALAVYLRELRDPSRGATYFHWANMASWAPNSRKIRIGGHVFWNM
jgi:spore germination cell wall hydrolase CwlJ-like protein